MEAWLGQAGWRRARSALNDIANILAERYQVDSEDRDAVFRAYADDHAVNLAG